jgi:hypothetical protein
VVHCTDRAVVEGVSRPRQNCAMVHLPWQKRNDGDGGDYNSTNRNRDDCCWEVLRDFLLRKHRQQFPLLHLSRNHGKGRNGGVLEGEKEDIRWHFHSNNHDEDDAAAQEKDAHATREDSDGAHTSDCQHSDDGDCAVTRNWSGNGDLQRPCQRNVEEDSTMDVIAVGARHLHRHWTNDDTKILRDAGRGSCGGARRSRRHSSSL